MFRLETLKKAAFQIGIFGGITTFIMINSVPYQLNKKIKESDVYQEAMKMMKSHPEAIKYLGEPIEDGSVKVTNKEMYGNDEEKSWFCVPLRGPKSGGMLRCESTIKTDNGETKVELSKVELTLKSLPGYKLLIKRSE